MDPPSQQKPFSSAAAVLLALGVGAAIGFGWIGGDWFAAGCLLLVVSAGCRGYRRGGLKIAGTVLGLLVAMHFAEPCSHIIAPYVERWIDVAGEYRGVILLSAAGVLLALIVVVSFRVVARFLLQSRPGWQHADHWLGAVLGGVQGALLSLILLFGISVLEPVAQQYLRGSQAFPESKVRRVASAVVSLNERAWKSSLQPVMAALQPVQVRLQRRASEVARGMHGNQESGSSNVIVLLRSIREGD